MVFSFLSISIVEPYGGVEKEENVQLDNSL